MNLFHDLSDLAAIESDCWDLLTRAATDSTCGWRLPVLATLNGNLPQQRIVVLRHVERTRKRILAHTDVRSAKVGQLANNPQTSWLFWDAVHRVQLSATGIATVHTDDDVAQSIWEAEAESSLRGYLGPYSPGKSLSAPEINLPDSVRGRVPKRSELEPARANFAVIACEFRAAEFVILRSDGNLRARFTYANGDPQEAVWLAP